MKTKLLTYMTIMCSTLYASANVTVINVAGETIFDGLVAPGQTVDELVETLYGLTHNLYDLALGEQKLLPETNLGDLGNVTLTAVAYDEIGRICGFIEEMLEKIEEPVPHYVFISYDGPPYYETTRLIRGIGIVAAKKDRALCCHKNPQKPRMEIAIQNGTISRLEAVGYDSTDATEITKAVRAEIMQIVHDHQSILGFSVLKAQIEVRLRNTDYGWGHHYECMANAETFRADALAGIKLILELVNRPSSVSAQ